MNTTQPVPLYNPLIPQVQRTALRVTRVRIRRLDALVVDDVARVVCVDGRDDEFHFYRYLC